MVKKRMLVVAVGLLILASTQVGSAGARHLTHEVPTEVRLQVDCEQVCVVVENL